MKSDVKSKKNLFDSRFKTLSKIKLVLAEFGDPNAKITKAKKCHATRG
jgi:hypothetical protein